MNPNSAMFVVPTNDVPGRSPSHNATPRARKRQITVTLIRANQNSNSPRFRTAAKLIAVKITIAVSAGIHGDTASHDAMMAEAPVISTAMIMIIMNQ